MWEISNANQPYRQRFLRKLWSIQCARDMVSSRTAKRPKTLFAEKSDNDDQYATPIDVPNEVLEAGTDLLSLLILLLLLLFLLGDLFIKPIRLGRFKLDRVKIPQDCSSSEYASTHRV